MLIPLGNNTLKEIAPSVVVPSYNRSALRHRIVHVGVGGFHRSHQARYLDDLHAAGAGEDWGICGICMLPRDRVMYDSMKKQDCLYTLVERDETGDKARVIGSIVDVLFAPDDPEAVIEKMASETCDIVSLTITEGGYYINAGTGAFDAANPDIAHDLAAPHRPIGVFGYLAEALARRRERGLTPFTIQSCDNIQNNGNVAESMFLAFVALRDKPLADWVRQEGAFPNSMVDRITPATTDEHRALVRDDFGIADVCPVVSEPFLQWVVEDCFVRGRPRWERAGATMTKDVLPYEKMKLRLLNASHQALCYIGMLLGYDFSNQAIDDPRIVTLLRFMMDREVTPLLPEVPGIDLDEYKDTLIRRFGNPILRDQLLRIGTEGSVRIPKFVLPFVEENLERGGPVTASAFTVAAWIRYLAGPADTGKELQIIDPLSETVVPIAKAAKEDPRPMLAMRSIFGDKVGASPVFIREVGAVLELMYSLGCGKTLDLYTGLLKKGSSEFKGKHP